MWVAPGVNYPEGWHLAFSPLAGAGVALALPFRNPVLGYNIAALASYPLAALGMYEWARRRTGSRAAALWAGLAYSWLPYRTARLLAGHFNLVGIGRRPG